ncbi:MAG: CobD/CbiB family cobalamin biosynthesis protein, partial [Eubacterium sp.]|nr:CobD/CbiB family cobalamin biosynthesis protein [Eubacterium sp.]
MWNKLSFLGLPVVLGFLVDQVLGDPHSLYHPVQLIGKYIDFFEKIFRSALPKTKKGERAGGTLCAIFVILVSTLLPWAVLFFLYHAELWTGASFGSEPAAVLHAIGFCLETFWCCQIVALKSLRDESMKVAKELEKGDLPAARRAVSMIVGRDTQNLTETGVAKAAVETVAENCSDGVIAPLLYLMLFGAVGGFFYKSVNTMDSMIG